MNKHGVLTTVDEIFEAGLNEFDFPTNEGEFIGKLVNRTWHKKLSALICFFETDNNKKYKLLVWNNNDYMPKKSQINFSTDVINGSHWKCTFNKTKNGSINWLISEEVL